MPASLITRALLVLIALSLAVTPLAAQVSAAAALRMALEKESVEGDLRGAIALYERAAREAGPDRTVAARALLAAADAYRKLGDPKARVVYETVATRYADQSVYAASARTRLGTPARVQVTPSLTTRRVMDGGDVERVSPDGRYLLTAGPQLALHDLATGKTRDITSDGNTDEAEHRYPLRAAFSADGQQVVYDLFVEKTNRSILRVVRLGETIGASRTLVDNPDIMTIQPLDWSRDGRWIAVSIRRVDRTAQIGLVDAAAGALRVLRSVEWIGPTHMAFSPDGRMLAYDRPSGEGEVERDVFAMAIDGSRESAVVVNPGDDRLVGWSPDGGHLLFTSNRGGTSGLWAVPMREGRGAQSAEFIAETGPSRPLGLTAAGTLYYKALLAGADIWTVAFERESHTLTSAPVRLLRQFKGLNQMPEWSADGRQVAHVSRRDVQVPSPVLIVISDATTGDLVREVPVRASYLAFPKWSPDGRTFVARGADLKGRSGILRIDAVTGDTQVVVQDDICTGVPYWAARGRTFYCTDFKSAVVAVDVDSGTVTRRFTEVSGNGAASPDGQWLVVWRDNGLVRISTTDGAQRLILPFTPSVQMGNLLTLTFTPDSRHVVFGGTVEGAKGIFTIPVDGGVPRRIPFDGDVVSTWRFNPTTWHVLYTPTNRPRTEVRALEHFLPVDPARSARAR